MVKIFAAVVKPMVRVTMKAYGMRPKLVEIEPGTILRFWVPCKSKINPAKPNVVFLHGFATDGIFNWQSQVQALSGKYSVYVPDLLFFGSSTTNKPERSMEFHAECLVKGLRSFGVDKFTVVGLSYGATLGFKMATLYPEMVQCIVASGTAMELTESISRVSLQNIGYSSWSEFLMPDSTKGLNTFLSIASQKPPSLPEFAAKDFLKEFFANRKERDELLKAWVINDNHVAPCNYSQKVYLIWGEDDKIFKKEVAENIKRYVIPPEHWVNAERPIKVKTANGVITIDKVCKNLDLIIEGVIFHIPIIYQQDAGMDFILGNIFCLTHGPFIQSMKYIVLHTLDKQEVWIPKVTHAVQVGIKGYLESRKLGSKKLPPKPINISSNKILLLERGRCKLEKFRQDKLIQKLMVLDLEKQAIVDRLLEKVCSDNPLDDKKTKNWMKASIKLIDPRAKCTVKPMKYSPQDREEFAKQIKELLDMKIIIPSKSPHMSPAFLVENEAERRRGKKRMVVNYKKMNDLTIGDGHNLPNKDELLALIRRKKVFSSLDCKSGFWQVLLDEDSQLLTAFTCPQGHYQWRVLPFGFKQAPSIFQRHMQTAFNPYQDFCCVYVDDILVFSNDENSHYRHLSAVLKKCETLGIILSKKKAHLFKTKINFLGLEIDQGTHCPQNHILEHIQKFPNRIEDKKQLQRFLGILTYASDYIEKLAGMRAPLQAKLKKDVPWKWLDSDTSYVAKIKKNLTSFPKLYHPESEDRLIIETDASHDYWGGVLKAVNSTGLELICRYTSGSFKDAERNYHSNEKEYLAVIRVINKFSIYLTPVHFTVRTDNKNFSYFRNLKIQGDNKQGRLVRWQQWLSRYSFTVEHIDGVKNSLADFLTREYYPSFQKD